MNFLVENNEHNISSVRRDGINGSYKINCNSNGINDYIIVCAKKREDLIINDNLDIQKQLSDNSEQLFLMKYYENVNVSFSLISFAELMRSGGFDIKNKPGFYTVYGCELDNNSIKDIYYAQNVDNKIVNISIDIEIVQENAYIEVKKLFKTERKYSGYKRITISKGIPSLDKNCVFYLTPDNKNRFSLPLKILQNGGSFFVKSKKEDDIYFVKFDNNINLLVSTKN